jgi:hypothetical protein
LSKYTNLNQNSTTNHQQDFKGWLISTTIEFTFVENSTKNQPNMDIWILRSVRFLPGERPSLCPLLLYCVSGPVSKMMIGLWMWPLSIMDKQGVSEFSKEVPWGGGRCCVGKQKVSDNILKCTKKMTVICG